VNTDQPWVCQSCGIARKDNPEELGLPADLSKACHKVADERMRTIGGRHSFDPSCVETSLEQQVS